MLCTIVVILFTSVSKVNDKLYWSFCNHGYRIHPQQGCILISGPTGVGKATVAKAVARACRVHLVQVSIIF